VNEVTTPRGYGIDGRSWWRADRAVTTVTDSGVVAIAAVVAVSVRFGSLSVALSLALVVGAVMSVRARSVTIVVVVVVCALGGSARSQQAWAGLAPDALGPFEGWVRLIDDPQPYASSTRVIIEVENERFELWSRGRSQQQRVHTWRGGEWVMISGDRKALDADRARRVAWQHVVGEFELTWASDVDAGGPVARASNRVRAAIERAAEAIPAPFGSLYRGLVIGDDRDQPREMVERFRASGLSHLTAVSGLLRVYVLARLAGAAHRDRITPLLRHPVADRGNPLGLSADLHVSV
jgi:competence protein ComEC